MGRSNDELADNSNQYRQQLQELKESAKKAFREEIQAILAKEKTAMANQRAEKRSSDIAKDREKADAKEYSKELDRTIESFTQLKGVNNTTMYATAILELAGALFLLVKYFQLTHPFAELGFIEKVHQLGDALVAKFRVCPSDKINYGFIIDENNKITPQLTVKTNTAEENSDSSVAVTNAIKMWATQYGYTVEQESEQSATFKLKDDKDNYVTDDELNDLLNGNAVPKKPLTEGGKLIFGEKPMGLQTFLTALFNNNTGPKLKPDPLYTPSEVPGYDH